MEFKRRQVPFKPPLERKAGTPVGLRLEASVIRRFDTLVEKAQGITTRHALCKIAVLKGLEWLEVELPKKLAG